MNGKLPICIENEKIKKLRKSLVGEINKEKDFFWNANLTIFQQIGNLPFRKEFFQRNFQPSLRYKDRLLKCQ